MRLSEKQFIILMHIFKDALNIAGTFGGYDMVARLKVYNTIINQQSEKLVELDKDGQTSIEGNPNEH